MLLWGIGTILLGMAVAYLLGTAQIRSLVLLLLGVLAVLCLKPRRGVYILLIFLPFMYYLRRQVLLFNEFEARDPILLFPSVVTIAMLLGIALFSGPLVFRYFSRSGLLKVIFTLLVVFALQMLNPLQGNILVGIAGGLYFVIPMLWVFPGLLVEERDVRRIFGLIVVIGTVTALYGIYQHYFGFSAVEQYELESKGMLKVFGHAPRVMSTFAGLGDYSLYMATTGIICFTYYWGAGRNPVYLALLGLTAFALLWASSRTTFLLLAFAMISFLIVNSKNRRQILARGALALITVSALYGYLYSYTPEDVYHAHSSSNPFIVHTIAGIAHPTEESTFQRRLVAWSYIVGSVGEYPYGRGLGSTTPAALKFVGGKGYAAESYFFELIYGSSLVAAILFVILMVSYLRNGLWLAERFGDNLTYRIVIAILSGYFLGSVFGACVRDTISGPLAWLLIGWTVREYVDRSAEAPAAIPGMPAAV